MSEPGAPTAESPWPVATLSTKIKGYIDRLGSVWVEGELTQWNLARGVVYAKLKDLEQDATVSLTVWSSTLQRLTETFAQGDRVVALVKPDFWMRGGTLSMVASEVRHAGLGDLLAQLERLKRTLQAEGLFAAERKKPLPFLPSCIGLVTGKDSDAEKDVLRNAQLRWPQVAFRVRHAAVQGDRAAREVAAAIRELDADPEVDVIIVARGGGDFQNLLVFSDEQLVRTAAECTTPLVSAIGHEADSPLLDLVADLRASTPTDAAKRVVPDVAEEFARVQQARGRMAMRMASLVGGEIDRVEALRSRPVLADPQTIVSSRRDDLIRLVDRGSQLAQLGLERAENRTRELASQLRALSPQRTLDRGYAVVRTGDAIVRDAAAVASGEALHIRLSSGELTATAE
ncbi:exodeoxyribonuclease VII large subunit [Homoserinibacter sp. GY 40078]|uniref:exodeoxyribonuclease VII large subunit n=1 Tax=Homoserinibacter sp. GY 40078 TaxID=2603275 RepID=UPI0011CC9233|nr:exodeoxyribonuclease VII large subunit [Homoserinibacter sp. GY 40078]TXK19565.1 exodeoxyribonuclease VII large subunit [Homoserinibacter sp. GY 40078]